MAEPGRKTLLQCLRSWDGLLALGFGSGLSPLAPGTAGTLLAVPLAWGLKALVLPLYLLVVVVMLLLGAWVCGRVGERLGVPDHGALVWDEMVGYAIAVALVPRHWGWMLAAFVLFRLFDILKPWPVRWAERALGGGWGVMMDDVVAGLLTAAVLWAAARWLLSP